MTHRVLIGAFESVPAGLYQMARAGAQLARLPKKDGSVEIRIASDPAASMGAVTYVCHAEFEDATQAMLFKLAWEVKE